MPKARPIFTSETVTLYEHLQRPVPLLPPQSHSPEVVDSTGNLPCTHWRHELQAIVKQLDGVELISCSAVPLYSAGGHKAPNERYNQVVISVQGARKLAPFLLEGGVELTDEHRSKFDPAFLKAITTVVTVQVAHYPK